VGFIRIVEAVGLATPFTVAALTDGPVNVAVTATPGCEAIAPFNKVGTDVVVVGRFTLNALLPNI
jgi:hypothetical protein